VQVQFSATARRHLGQIKDWLEDAAGTETAAAIADDIIAAAESLKRFPYRGSPRFDLSRPGLRSIKARHNVSIVYRAEPGRIVIIAIRYAGQDWPGLLEDR
jgi:toxin ParE1/3/4